MYLKKSKKLISFIILSILLSFSGCGSSNGNDGIATVLNNVNTPEQLIELENEADQINEEENIPEQVSIIEKVTGQFVDDPVAGLTYVCSSGISGITNANGEYTCQIGDNVTFSIGSVIIGTVAAQEEMITPYSFFPDDTTAALNVAKLLQSLDSDNNATNGVISLDSSLVDALPEETSFTSETFTSDVESALEITLVSDEEAQEQLNDTIVESGGSIPEGGHPPVADAGIDQAVFSSETVILNGIGSSDSDGDTLTYSWSFVSVPNGSSIVISDATLVSTSFIPDIEGTYVVQLIVNDGAVNSAADTVTILVAVPSTSDLHIRSAVYDNNKTASVLDDTLYVYFSEPITPASLAVDQSTNYDITGTGVIGSASISNYTDTIIPRHTLLLNSSGTTSTALLPDSTTLSMAESTIKDSTGVYPKEYNQTTVEAFIPTFKTGQTTSYLANDDGTYQTGVTKSYTDNGDGTVIDNVTGLIWQQDPDPSKTYRRYTFDEAVSYCGSLNLGGSTAWRLPTIEETSEIIDYSRSVNYTTIPEVFTGGNGTYRTNSNYSGDITYAYLYLPDDGQIQVAPKTLTTYVRCVR